MIKKSLLTALAILGAYHLALPHLSHKFYQILGQQRGNYNLAQHYVLDVPSGRNVIVGSSIANTLNDGLLGNGYLKLTFPGGSIFTALEMIRQSEKRPRVVLIETNLPGRDADKELLHDLFSPLLLALRRHSGIFREEGRPSNFIGGMAEAFVRRGCQITSRALYGNGALVGSVATESLPPAVLSKLLRIEREDWDSKPPATLLTKQTNELGDYVDALGRDGSVCILFEMPVDASLFNLTSARLWRQAMNERFPHNKYHWLSFEPDHVYRTKDGIHLVPEEADRLTEVMVNQVNQIMRLAGKPESASPQLASTSGDGL